MSQLLGSIDIAKNIRSEYASHKTNLGFNVFKSLQRTYTALADRWGAGNYQIA
jgi:hypothetical protein